MLYISPAQWIAHFWGREQERVALNSGDCRLPNQGWRWWCLWVTARHMHNDSRGERGGLNNKGDLGHGYIPTNWGLRWVLLSWVSCVSCFQLQWYCCSALSLITQINIWYSWRCQMSTGPQTPMCIEAMNAKWSELKLKQPDCDNLAVLKFCCQTV